MSEDQGSNKLILDLVGLQYLSLVLDSGLYRTGQVGID